MGASRGGLVVFAVLGGVLALGLAFGIVMGARAWMDRASPTPGASGGPVAPAPGRASAAARDGMQARGTQELRNLGCNPAIVMDMLRLVGDARALRDDEPRYVVTCDVTSGEPPTCEHAAAVYFTAVAGDSDGNVNLRIGPRGATRPTCSRLYAASGADLGPYPRIN